MRGLVERRSLAAALTRARGPCCIRTLSGIGRGQGDGRESGIGRGLGVGIVRDSYLPSEDANAEHFAVSGGGYGHGAPLHMNSPAVGRPGMGAASAEEAATQNDNSQPGNAAGGRSQPGISGYGPAQMTGNSFREPSNRFMGRGSPLQHDKRPSGLQAPEFQDSFFSDMKPSKPLVPLSLGGVGRGKPVQNVVPQTSSEAAMTRRVIPQWEEGDPSKKSELTDRTLSRPAAWKSNAEERTVELGKPGALPAASKDAFVPGRSMQPPRPAYGFTQSSRFMDQDRPEQQVKLDKGDESGNVFRPGRQADWQYTAASKGVPLGQEPQWGESYYDSREPRLQKSPPLGSAEPTSADFQTGESYYNKSRQPPSPTLAPPESRESNNNRSKQSPWSRLPTTQLTPHSLAEAQGGGFYDNAGRQLPPPTFPASERGESFYNASRQAPPPPVPPTFPASETGESYYKTSRQPHQPTFSASGFTQNFPATPHGEESFHKERRQQPWSTVATSGSTQQFPPEPQSGHWYHDTSSQAPQPTLPTFESTQRFSPGQEPYYNGSWQPSWSTSPTSESSGQFMVGPQSNEYYDDRSRQPPESIVPPSESTQQFSAQTHFSPQTQMGYDAMIEDYYRQGRLEDIDGIYSEMKAAQVQASAKTYDMLMQTYLKLGKVDKMSQVYQEMRDVIMPSGVMSMTQDMGAKEETTRTAVEVRESAAMAAFPEDAPYEAGYPAFNDSPHSEEQAQTWDGTDAELRERYGPAVGLTMSTDHVKDSSPFRQPDVSAHTPAPFGRQKSTAGAGAGRGTPVEKFFGFRQPEGNVAWQKQQQSLGMQQMDTIIEPSQAFEQSQPTDTRFSPYYPVSKQGQGVATGVGRGRHIQKSESPVLSDTTASERGGFPKSESGDNLYFDHQLGYREIGLGRGKPQPDQQLKSYKGDDYSETFRPVIQPEWQYTFAPEGLPGGPGVGRGRPISPQHVDGAVGSQQPIVPEPIGAAVGSISGVEAQHHHPAVGSIRGIEAQHHHPAVGSIRGVEAQHHHPPEHDHPRLSQEAAGDRAMQILDERLKKKFHRLEEWSATDDDARYERRARVQIARAGMPKEKKQLSKRREKEEEVELTEEQKKKEIELMKAMEKSEEIQQLEVTFGQFMLSLGSMGVEPEYIMGDFMTNPDIDEKPFPSLEEYLEKAKPNILKTGIVRSEEEWQRMVKDVIRNAPLYEEFVEEYSGPGRYTAKQENEDLEAIASTLPSDVGPKLQKFVQRSLTTLKSNPGFNLDEKQWMLANMVEEFSQYQYDAS